MIKAIGRILQDIFKVSIISKGPPKRLNSAASGMQTYWPKMMFECCPKIHIYALRPPLLIYASKLEFYQDNIDNFIKIS